jgi:hypothetical protein
MKQLAILALALGLSTATQANPIQIPGFGQDMPKNGTGGDQPNANNDASNFFRLETVVNAWNAANPSNLLPEPISTGAKDLGSPIVGPGGLVGFDYAVLHYGVGNGGVPGSGGGVEVFFLNGATEFTFPANGSGPNGFGGFSSLTLFAGPGVGVPLGVPDGGSTVLLLGFVLSGLGLLCGKLR